MDDTRGYERDMYSGGGRVIDRDRQKTELQDRMTYGRNAPTRVTSGDAPPAQPAPRPKPQSEAASLHAQVSAEIEERNQFLDSMRKMGRGEEHEHTIKAQVAERMEELGKLERMMRE
mmetsp:Transcript_23619/g.60269  ORF Transcript_23619/g.60269 Transcript_23619/m.60269 type:complete len:117 (+) Transcript_23619:355-705(+)